MKLSATQWLALSAMVASNAPYYGRDTDRTMKALERRGLVRFSRARKYGKDSWSLVSMAEAIAALERP